MMDINNIKKVGKLTPSLSKPNVLSNQNRQNQFIFDCYQTNIVLSAFAESFMTPRRFMIYILMSMSSSLTISGVVLQTVDASRIAFLLGKIRPFT
jgi:hypothetical protein